MKDIPVLSLNRKNDHFERCDSNSSKWFDNMNSGKIVYVFWKSTGNWEKGKVVYGYMSGECFVHYVLDNFPESKFAYEYGDNTTWGDNILSPNVLLKKEFDYFKRHVIEFEKWLRLCRGKYERLD